MIDAAGTAPTTLANTFHIIDLMFDFSALTNRSLSSKKAPSVDSRLRAIG
jgi:hypothetical protein